METDYNLIFKILGYIAPVLYGFFKLLTRHIMKEIDKKVDKTLYEKEMSYLKLQREEDRKSLYKKMDSLEASMKELNKNILTILTQK